jgi:hypothetical protein
VIGSARGSVRTQLTFFSSFVLFSGASPTTHVPFAIRGPLALFDCLDALLHFR